MEIDHIGVVVENIESAVGKFTSVYGFTIQTEPIYDSAQHVKLAMLESANGYRVELVQPVDKESPSYDFMKTGGGLHHLCYSVTNIEDSIKTMKQEGHLLFKRPVEAPLLGRRKVAFFFSKRDKQIVELVETEGK